MPEGSRDKMGDNFFRFVSETDNFVLNSLIYCKPMKIFQNRIYMMEFWSSGDGTDNRVENK
jgi:hypothetical protein